MIRQIVILFLLTLIPTLELRYSIPHGFVVYYDSLGPAAIVLVCVLANIALAPLVWIFVHYVMDLFLRVGWIDRLYRRVLGRSSEKLGPYLDKWGTMGLALFIGVPLPGSGVYSGALGAYVLGFNFRQYFMASVLGVLIAGTAVTIVTISGATAFDFMLKH